MESPWAGVGVSGEFSLSGGVTSGLSAFVMMPDSMDSLCFGVVAGGVKFCTLVWTLVLFPHTPRRWRLRGNIFTFLLGEIALLLSTMP